MKLLSKFSGLVLIWWMLVGCTFAKDGYRVWIGDNKQTDWIDVYAEWSNQEPGREGEWVTTFSDPSPIESVIQRMNLGDSGCHWLLKKAHSVWLLESPTGAVTDYTLRRVNKSVKEPYFSPKNNLTIY